MTRSEQHRMILELREFASSMNGEDVRTFEMLSKRDKDDEDLDSIAIRILERLHQQYVRRKTKKDIEALWKTLTKEKKHKREDE